MLAPRKFEKKYPPEELADKLPDRPITSLRDIQYLYGRLYTLATAGGGDYASYLTTDQANDLIDEPESLIVVRVDLSGNKPRLADDPVWVTKYEEDLIEHVAHCKYNAARGFDHSITHRSGRNSDREKLTRYAKERLTTWAVDDVVNSVATDHVDGWIIEALATLGKQEDELKRIEDALEASLGGSTTALLTVQVKLTADGPYQWPGEIDVFNAAMRARKLSKLVSKGKATESAGTAIDLLTSAVTRTVGTAEDPLNYYLGKQMEKFPGFDPNEAWRTHPVSEDAAVTIMNAETFVDSCTYSTFGSTVYYLPYVLGDVSPEDAYKLYSLLFNTVNAEEMNPIEVAYEHLNPTDLESYDARFRFYVSAVMKHQMSRYDVFGDTLNGSLLHPSDLAIAHEEILASWVYDVDEQRRELISPAFPTHEKWPLLRDSRPLNSIVTGGYFYSTFRKGDDDQNASADDERIKALVSVLSGEPISVEALISTYVDRLIAEEGESFPTFIVASQFAQLCALAAANLLTTRNPESNGVLTEPPVYDPQLMTEHDTRARTDGGRAARRDAKLEQFIDETAALSDPQRRGSFLIGVLVGQVGGYQQSAEGRSTTVVDQYSIKSMTKTRIKRITQEVLDRNLVYSRENHMRSTMYAEVVDRLVDTLTERDPDAWDINTDDLRFYYALGVSYGLNSWTKKEGADEDTEDN